MHKHVLWITRTAVSTALLVVLQAATMALGNQIVTGSIVNLMLIVSVMICGLSTGITVAVISPVMARLFGIGPLWGIIPFIILGNIVLVILWDFIGNLSIRNKYIPYIAALASAAAAKALVLYIGIVRIAIPFILEISEQQAKVISGMFSVTQLITAATGGVCATIILSTLKKAVPKDG